MSTQLMNSMSMRAALSAETNEFKSMRAAMSIELTNSMSMSTAMYVHLGAQDKSAIFTATKVVGAPMPTAPYCNTGLSHQQLHIKPASAAAPDAAIHTTTANQRRQHHSVAQAYSTSSYISKAPAAAPDAAIHTRRQTNADSSSVARLIPPATSSPLARPQRPTGSDTAMHAARSTSGARAHSYV